jgi:hypothetical protein
MAYTYCCVYSTRLMMMERKPFRNMYSSIPKNKFEKLMHLVGFIIGIRSLISCYIFLLHCGVDSTPVVWSWNFSQCIYFIWNATTSIFNVTFFFYTYPLQLYIELRTGLWCHFIRNVKKLFSIRKIHIDFEYHNSSFLNIKWNRKV